MSKTPANLFRFVGTTDTAVNLAHVTNISREGLKITFTFYTNTVWIDLPTEEEAKEIFEEILRLWACVEQE